jgi:hypothetical protein
MCLVHRRQPYLLVLMDPLPWASGVLGSPRMPQPESFLGLEMIPVPLRARTAGASSASSLDSAAALPCVLHTSTCYIMRGRSTFSPSETSRLFGIQWSSSDRPLTDQPCRIESSTPGPQQPHVGTSQAW